MVLFRSVMLIAGVLGVLLLGGGTAVAAAPDHAARPCHGSTATDPAGPEQPEKPQSEVKAMACCVACVAASLPASPPAPHAAPAGGPHGGALPGPLTGLSPAPEPHPPRDVAI